MEHLLWLCTASIKPVFPGYVPNETLFSEILAGWIVVPMRTLSTRLGLLAGVGDGPVSRPERQVRSDGITTAATFGTILPLQLATMD
ncbi:hypothetical protein NKI51_05415 [Mesorhizobium australicum]|uniref:hypothetical protein n=1 Tax=Mesorhizobium australicum TaxID=536018 RepID=UPI00333828E6